MSAIYNKTSWVDDSVPALNASNLNNIEDGIEDAARQDLSIVHKIASDANYTLTASQNQYGRIEITDTVVLLTAGRDIIMSNNEHTFLFVNSTNQTLTVKTSAGSGITVDGGKVKKLRNNTIDVVEYEPIRYLDYNNFVHVQDQKPNGTAGGGNVAGFQTRTLNTVLVNNIAGASLSTDKISLPLGTYYAECKTIANRVGRTKANIRNVGDTATLLVGISEVSSSSDASAMTSDVSGFFTLGATKEIDVRHYMEIARAIDGLGNATSAGDVEVYTDLKIWKVG